MERELQSDSELFLTTYYLLSITINVFAFESTFYIGCQIHTRYQYCLLQENIEALISTRSWSYRFKDNI